MVKNDYDLRIAGQLAILNGVSRDTYRSKFNGRVMERPDGALVVQLSDDVAYCRRKEVGVVSADVMVKGTPVLSALGDGDILWYHAADSLDGRLRDMIARKLETAADLAMSKTYAFWDKLRIT